MIRRGLFGALFIVLAGPALTQSALPFNVGGPYALVNHHGAPHTQSDPDGRPQLLFFGYANCPGICTAALPLMGDVTTALAESGIALRPVMITVDPVRDTVENMAEPLTKLHPDFIGLTGDAAPWPTPMPRFRSITPLPIRIRIMVRSTPTAR